MSRYSAQVPSCVLGIYLQGQNKKKRSQNPKALPLCYVDLVEEEEFLAKVDEVVLESE